MKPSFPGRSSTGVSDLRAWVSNQIATRGYWELLRYLVMGGIGALSYLLFSNFYNWLGVPTHLSPFYAWLSGLVIVYFGHMKFTYRVRARHKQMVLRFLIMQSYNLAMSTFSTVVVRDWMQFPYFIASITALATTVPVLYVLGKYWVYQPGRTE
ncbi:putative flippase GtrA [Rhizobium sp. BK226]|uniref:GtrA family protein n=1 Tax=Rhizobium sp. BK226 TaxID=2587075 RepID=UPI001612AF11|nr:GtrA family protein [Rhizobium sp. BK226]MBB4116328.1 putative flippase GtrA [Rhizobium sp. BK226]